MPVRDAMLKARTFVRSLSDALMSFLGVLVLLMMAAIALQVFVSRLGLNTIISWEPTVFLFGRGLERVRIT